MRQQEKFYYLLENFQDVMTGKVNPKKILKVVNG